MSASQGRRRADEPSESRENVANNREEHFLTIDEQDRKDEAAAKSFASRLRKHSSKLFSSKLTYIAIAFALVVLVALIYVYNTKNESPAPEVKPPEATPASIVSDEGPWYLQDPSAAMAVELPTWAQDYGMIDASAFTAEQKEYFIEQTNGSPFEAVVLSTLFSQATYTDDFSKASLKSGLPNPEYTYITSERFLVETNAIMEKLLNPYWGGWGHYQYAESNASKEFDPQVLSQVFTEKYIASNFTKANKAHLPVYADWTNNDYGMKDLIPAPGKGRWTGRIIDAQLNIPKNFGATISATYKVEWVAMTTAKKQVKKEGTMTVNYLVDPKAISDKTNLRILIDSVTVKMS